MHASAPLSSHPTPYEPFFDAAMNGDTVVQTVKQRRKVVPSEDAYPTPQVSFQPPVNLRIRNQLTDLVGQTLGDFAILEYHGRGGVGAVYKARQLSRDRLVAVKVLHARHLHDEICVTRFLNEAHAAASLRHPNVIKVHQVNECAAGYYYAMEFIDGPSLELYAREGERSLLWIVNTVTRLAETIAYAHRRGLVHRDLKPANVLLDGPDRPVLIDFGLVKYLSDPAGLTREGEVLGTPAYMAPEQAGDEPDAVGPACDIYALGAILYTLLTRRVPYDGGSSLSTILKVVGPELPPSIRALRPEVPEELEHLCMTCLNKNPADRYGTAEQLADALRQVQTTLIQGERPA